MFKVLNAFYVIFNWQVLRAIQQHTRISVESYIKYFFLKALLFQRYTVSVIEWNSILLLFK